MGDKTKARIIANSQAHIAQAQAQLDKARVAGKADGVAYFEEYIAHCCRVIASLESNQTVWMR